MRMTWLASSLRAAGLRVIEEPGWRTRGRDWSSGRPYGGMQHHTAPPVPFPVRALYANGRIKCNTTTTPMGIVHVVAAGRCNYSSGYGSGVVLSETKRAIAPTGTAKARGLSDTTGGNSFYFNEETQHAGDGGTIPRVQLDAVQRMWVVVFDRLGLKPEQLIAHAEWSRRKPDPRWDGNGPHTNLNHMRADLGGAPPPPPSPPDEEDDMLTPFYLTDGYDSPNGAGRTAKRSDVRILQGRLGQGDPDGKYGPGTAAQVAAVCGGDGSEVDGTCWNEITERYVKALGSGDDNGEIEEHKHEAGAVVR